MTTVCATSKDKRISEFYVYEPSALPKKPSPSVETFGFSEEAFRFAVLLCRKCILESVLILGIIFFYAYCIYVDKTSTTRFKENT